MGKTEGFESFENFEALFQARRPETSAAAVVLEARLHKLKDVAGLALAALEEAAKNSTAASPVHRIVEATIEARRAMLVYQAVMGLWAALALMAETSVLTAVEEARKTVAARPDATVRKAAMAWLDETADKIRGTNV